MEMTDEEIRLLINAVNSHRLTAFLSTEEYEKCIEMQVKLETLRTLQVPCGGA